MFNRILIKGFIGAATGSSVSFVATSINQKSESDVDYSEPDQHQCPINGSDYYSPLFNNRQNVYWAPQQESSAWNFAIPFVALGGFVAGIIYGTYEELTRNQQTVDDNNYTCLTLQNAAKNANAIYKSESRLPFAKSKLGGEFGFFSFVRHASSGGDTFEKNLTSFQNVKEAQKFLVETLNKEGSLWSYTKGFNHSFINYFLTCLRYENIEAYRDIVGKAYGIKFISGSITLYRRDSRTKAIIFAEGFQLKEHGNTYLTRKENYAEPATYSFGVSFSKKIPPAHYGNGWDYYVVNLSCKQNFLLIDIVESPRNKGKLSQYHINLQEVNSLDGIPPEAIETYVTAASNRRVFGIFRKPNKTTPNTTFSKESLVDKKSQMGCY